MILKHLLNPFHFNALKSSINSQRSAVKVKKKEIIRTNSSTFTNPTKYNKCKLKNALKVLQINVLINFQSN